MTHKSSRCIASALILFASSAAVPDAADSAYPIKIGPTHRYFVDQNNRPFLMQGDSAWSMISGTTREEVELYLEHAP